MTWLEVLLRTSISIALSTISVVLLTYVASNWMFGSDPEALLRAGDVAIAVYWFGAIASAFVGGALSFRANLLLRQLADAKAELWRISRTDQLTGLLNRRGFDEAAIAALEKAHGQSLPAVALMCDIDKFKAINDQFGHEFGDAVLAEIGEVLKSFADEHHVLVGRHGGEEFAALVIGATSEQAMRSAEILRQACAKREVARGGVLTRVTVSIGLAASKGGESLAKMLKGADQALYRAKHGGRNQVALAAGLDVSVA